jgi:hypothetical protein
MTDCFEVLPLDGIREQAWAYRPTFNWGPEDQLLSWALKMNVFLQSNFLSVSQVFIKKHFLVYK